MLLLLQLIYLRISKHLCAIKNTSEQGLGRWFVGKVFVYKHETLTSMLRTHVSARHSSIPCNLSSG